MRFQTKLYSLPVYMLAPNQPAPPETPMRSAAFGSPNIWVGQRPNGLIDVSSAARLASDLVVNLVRFRRGSPSAGTTRPKAAGLLSWFDDRDAGMPASVATTGYAAYEFDAVITDAIGRPLRMGLYGLEFGPTPITMQLSPADMLVIEVSTPLTIALGGCFRIRGPPPSGKWASATFDTSKRPILGNTDDPALASSFFFTWDRVADVKTITRLILRTRFLMDHPKLLPRELDRDYVAELGRQYNDLGQALIVLTVSEDIPLSGSDSPAAASGMVVDAPTGPLGYAAADSTLSAGDYVGDVHNPMFDGDLSGFGELKCGVTLPGVAEQRAATGANSDLALKAAGREGAATAAVSRAARQLRLLAPWPAEFDRIEKMVAPIGSNVNSYPEPIVFNIQPALPSDATDVAAADGGAAPAAAPVATFGVNMAHPIVRGAAGSPSPLFVRRPGDVEAAPQGGGPAATVAAVPFSESFAAGGTFDTRALLWLLLIIVVVYVAYVAYVGYDAYNRKSSPATTELADIV